MRHLLRIRPPRAPLNLTILLIATFALSSMYSNSRTTTMNPKFKPPESSTSPSSPSQSFHHLAPPRRFDAVQHPPADIYIAKGVFEILENDLVGDEEVEK